MPRIPYESAVDVRGLRTDSSIRTSTSARAFGSDIGEATNELGRVAGNAELMLIEQHAKERKQERDGDVANNVAQFDFSKIESGLKNGTDADATDYRSNTVSAYRDAVETHVEGIEDNYTRLKTKERLLSSLPTVAQQAEDYEYKSKELNSKQQANDAIGAVQNKITSDPVNYDSYVQQGVDIIETRPNIPAVLKSGMQNEWKQNSAKARFEGMLTKSTTVAELDALAGELTDLNGKRDWTKEFKPEDYQQMVNSIGTRKKTLETAANSAADAALTTVEDRTSKLGMIPNQELQQAQETVKSSTSVEKQRRMARVMRDQSLIRDNRALPPAELRAQINATNGNPGLAYPDLPPEVSDSVNRAASAFGIDAGYLGGTVTKEYGGNFKKPKLQTNDTFKPQTLRGDIDLRNMRGDVLDSLTIAGEAVGKPLIIAAPSGGSSTGAVISTAGMSEQDKAAIAGSLVDAGFTGFAEYENTMRVDFLPAVPKDFGTEKEGKVWGGWTNLSPDVVKVLQEKGFTGGAESSTIKRNSKVKREPIDYGKATSIVGEDGKPTSSAVGVAQFTDSTFLEIVKEQSAAIGVDVTGKTDAQILEMRKDPNISIMAAAAYGAKNKKTLEVALGRDVSQSELYMAHFMGAGGATVFLNAYRNNPEQSAADLMPGAAKVNKAVFYRDGEALTVSQVYNNISQGFTLTPSRVAFEDNQVRQRILDQAQKQLQSDPIAHAASVGSHVITPLTEEGGFAARGAQSQAVAQYYGLDVNSMKPLTEDEANWIKTEIDTGDADKTLNVMASISGMGTKTARAAMKQLEQKDPVFTYAGDLYLDGSPDVAASIIRGRNKVTQNPALKSALGIEDGVAINRAFAEYTQASLSNIAPEQRQAVQDAALGYWINEATSSRSGNATFSPDDFNRAVQTVMGGTPGRPALADVNGEVTWLPKGLSADTIEGAIRKMTVQDYVRMSDSGEAPRYRDGTVINPKDIGSEVMLQSVGGGKYRMMLDDGSVLLTNKRTQLGRAEVYVFKPDPKFLSEIYNRPDAADTTASAETRALMLGSVR